MHDAIRNASTRAGAVRAGAAAMNFSPEFIDNRDA